MPADPRYGAVANREVALADTIPYSTHVTDHVIKTREGDYLRIWKLAGIAFEAADPADILVRRVQSVGAGTTRRPCGALVAPSASACVGSF